MVDNNGIKAINVNFIIAKIQSAFKVLWSSSIGAAISKGRIMAEIVKRFWDTEQARLPQLGGTMLVNRGAEIAGPIDDRDYTVWKSNFGNFAPGFGVAGVSPDYLAAPEPSTFLLSAFGLVAAAVVGRRKSASANTEIRSPCRRHWQLVGRTRICVSC